MTCAMRKTAMCNAAERISALRACAALNSVYFSFVRFFAGAFLFCVLLLYQLQFSPSNPSRTRMKC